MGIEVLIQLGYSRSSQYDSAVSIIEKLPNHSFSGDGSKRVHLVTMSVDEAQRSVPKLIQLVELAAGWKPFSIKINAVVIRSRDFQNFLVKTLKCSSMYDRSVNKETFCRSSNSELHWPCKHITSPSLAIEECKTDYTFSSWAKYWFQHGELEIGVWRVDKHSIRSKVEHSINDNCIAFCPHYESERVNQIIDQLPNTIDPNNDFDWKYQVKEESIGDMKEKVIVGVMPKDVDESLLRRSNSVYTVSLGFGRNTINEVQETESEHRIESAQVPNITYKDIGGLSIQKQRIRETIELPFTHPEIYKHLGIKPHTGILLYGPPGNGKTMLAKAIANSLKASFFLVNGPELSNKYYGETESNVRQLFASARKQDRSVIFFDEIDAIAKTRNTTEASHLDSKVLTQLLSEMDGVKTESNVLVVGSTNRIDVIDEAMLRPGRLDFHLLIPNPDEEGREHLITLFLQSMPVGSDVELASYVKLSNGMSASEIQFVCKEAALNSLKRKISLDEALETVGNIDLTCISVDGCDFKKAFQQFDYQRFDANASH